MVIRGAELDEEHRNTKFHFIFARPFIAGCKGTKRTGTMNSLRPTAQRPKLRPTRRWLHVQLPISIERSLLDLLFAKQEVQCCADNVRTFPKLRCQIVLANHHVPSW